MFKIPIIKLTTSPKILPKLAPIIKDYELIKYKTGVAIPDGIGRTTEIADKKNFTKNMINKCKNGFGTFHCSSGTLYNKLNILSICPFNPWLI